MNLLIDTHAFLWFVNRSPELSAVASRLIADRQNQVFLSAATPWELAIKISVSKLHLPEPLEKFVDEALSANRFDLLPVTVKHSAILAALPLHHRDPFDRMIIAQAIVEKMPVISRDPLFDSYGITRLW